MMKVEHGKETRTYVLVLCVISYAKFFHANFYRGYSYLRPSFATFSYAVLISASISIVPSMLFRFRWRDMIILHITRRQNSFLARNKTVTKNIHKYTLLWWVFYLYATNRKLPILGHTLLEWYIPFTGKDYNCNTEDNISHLL